MSAPTPDPVDDICPCYKCSGPVYKYDDEGNKHLWNNLHGRLQPCGECGRAKTEWVDLGTKGYHECWWCRDRAAGPLREPMGVFP